MAAVDGVEGREQRRARLNQYSYLVIGTAQKVHGRLGFGFLEKVYEKALCLELASRGVDFRQQGAIQVHYDGQVIGAYVPDLVVERSVVEIKAVEPRNHPSPPMPQLPARKRVPARFGAELRPFAPRSGPPRQRLLNSHNAGSNRR